MGNNINDDKLPMKLNGRQIGLSSVQLSRNATTKRKCDRHSSTGIQYVATKQITK